MNYTAKIDVTKIDKAHLYNGKYLDVVIWENRDGPGKYGDTHMVVQSVSKEARQAGKKGAIIGNLRPLNSSGGSAQPKKASGPDEDVPF
jgi:hypothetical protein